MDFERGGSRLNQIHERELMKMRRMKYRAGVLAFVLTLSGCGRKEAETTPPPLPEQSAIQKMKHDAREAVDATKEYFVRQKDELKKSLSGRMAELDKQLSELKASSRTAGDSARTEWTNALARLERQQAVANEKLDQFKNASEQTWQEVKAG